MITANYVDLIDNNVGVLASELIAAQKKMIQQFQQMFYSTVAASCDQNGNVVDAGGQGLTMATLEALWEKLQIEVKADGTVSLPELHLGTEAYEQAQALFQSASPEAQARFDAILARKVQEGRLRETERQAKFVRYGDAK